MSEPTIAFSEYPCDFGADLGTDVLRQAITLMMA
jgi:hypothetical protein